MLKGFGRNSILVSSAGQRSFSETASATDFSAGGNYGIGASAIVPNTDLELLEGLVSFKNEVVMRRLYRDMYYHDVICGGAVDIQAFLPYSEFELAGVKDPKRLEVYSQAMENLSILTLLPCLSVDHMVLGAHASVPNFSDAINNYESLTPLNIDLCHVTPAPLFNMEPIIDLHYTKDYQKYLDNATDPRYQRIADKMPAWMKEGIMKGKVLLDPGNVIYYPRRTFSTSSIGTSYFRRIVPIHLMEKAILRGSISQAFRRLRAIGLITAGDEDWEPTNAELSNINSMFCLTGDTLVSLSGKLKRVDSFAAKKNYEQEATEPLSISLKGIDGKIVPTTHWHYRGKSKVIEITTRSGSTLKATKDHKIQILNDNLELVWKKVKDLEIDDLMCLTPPKTGSINNKILKFDLELPELINGKEYQTKSITTPTLMSTDLAYTMGILISEGDITKHYFRVTNSQPAILAHTETCIKNVFNIAPVIHEVDRVGQTIEFGSVKTVCKTIYEVLNVHSLYTCSILNRLGVKFNTELRKNDKTPSWYKEIPWSILEADNNSKYAFIAAYIDGDGRIDCVRNDKGFVTSFNTMIYSRSKKLLQQFKIMLLDLGYHSVISKKYGRLTINSIDSLSLYEKIIPYLQHPDKIYDTRTIEFGTNVKSIGIPATSIFNVVNARWLKGEMGADYFTDDEGNLVKIPAWKTKSWRFSGKNCILSFNKFDTEPLNDFLRIIHKISKILHSRIMNLKKIGYLFDPIIAFRKLRKKVKVYDLSIDRSEEPAFIANGLVVHNSQADQDPIGAMITTRQGISYQDIREGGQFWSFENSFENLANAKMRGLGLNETILSGDANYSNLDSALSVFVDKMKTERDCMTRAVFYDRILPNIAITNHFKKNERKHDTTDTSGYPTLSSSPGRNPILRTLGGEYVALCNSAAAHIHGEIANVKDYDIPTLHWHKQLEPKGDREYVDLLSSLEEKGVPIPLRLYAASVGVDLDSVIDGLNEDKLIRKKFSDFNSNLADEGIDVGATNGDGTGDTGDTGSSTGESYASIINGQHTGSGIRPVGLANRTVDREDPRYQVRSSDGKALSARTRKEREEAINRVAGEVLAQINKKEIGKQNSSFQTMKEKGGGKRLFGHKR